MWAENSKLNIVSCILVAEDTVHIHTYSEDSDVTARLCRLIYVFSEHTDHFVGFVMLWLISPTFRYSWFNTGLLYRVFGASFDWPEISAAISWRL